jgi:hypothetical protein
MVMLVAAQPTPSLPCRDLATMPGNHSSSSSGGERCKEREKRGVWQWFLRKKVQFASEKNRQEQKLVRLPNFIPFLSLSSILRL